MQRVHTESDTSNATGRACSKEPRLLRPCGAHNHKASCTGNNKNVLPHRCYSHSWNLPWQSFWH